MKTWMLLGMLALAGVAQAASAKKADDPAATAAQREQMDQRAQMMVTLQLSEALELDDAGTLKLRQTVAQWDAQRAPLRQQMFDLAQVLRRAAKGDTTAYGQVDPSIQKIIDLRAQMHQIDQACSSSSRRGCLPRRRPSSRWPSPGCPGRCGE